MKSKSILLTALPMLLFCMSRAQETGKFSIGVQGGPTYSNFHIHNSAYQSDHAVFGYNYGLSGQFNLSKRFALQLELNHERIGSNIVYTGLRYNGESSVPITGPFAVKTNSYSYYFSMPLSFKFHFVNRDKIKFFVRLGTSIDYNYLDRTITDYEDGSRKSSNDTHSFTMGMNYRPGVISGVGMDVTLSKKIHFIAELRDHLFLSDYRTIKANAVALNIGFIYKF